MKSYSSFSLQSDPCLRMFERVIASFRRLSTKTMQLGILSLLLVVCSSAAIVDNVCVAMDGSQTCSTDLSSTQTKFVFNYIESSES